MFQKILEKMSTLQLRARPAQINMMQFVYDALTTQGILCVEAPTGTGKTLAYSVAGIKARETTQVLIVSTATTALQEQFFHNDLPLLEKLFDEKFQVMLAKGRRRYVCHARLFHPEQFSEDDSAHPELTKLQDQLTHGHWDGALDTLPIKLEQTLWQKISTDAHGCSAGRCAYFNQCVFFQNRRKMHNADIVVTNHSLLLSDLELGGGVILPNMKDSIYIIDECHHLPEKALSHFSKQAAVLRSLEWINGIGKAINKVVLHSSIEQQNCDDLNRYTKELVDTLRRAKAFVDEQIDQFEQEQWRVAKPQQRLLDIAQSIVTCTRNMSTVLQLFVRHLEKAYEEQQSLNPLKAELIAQVQASINFIVDRCNNLQETWRDVLSLGVVENKAPIACWFERTETREGLDYTLHTAPINISSVMKELFWNKIEHGAVLCSATIRSMGSFDDFLRKLGLKNDAHTSTQKLPSPFDYQHSILFVPKMQHEPTPQLQEMHLQEMLTLLPQLIFPFGGTLVLFTSRRAMAFVFKHTASELKEKILLQDDYSKMDLIKRHKKKIDEQQQSIIFGLSSFAEGINLPGNYCVHVIIQKIPFSVPSDPIAQTRSDWLKQHNKDPFQLITLPETSVKLAQYVGRLLRNEQDRGIVTILDKRLYTKRYGSALLDTMPEFTRLLNCSLAQFCQHDAVKKLASW